MYADPIADFLTRIRNGASAGHRNVEMPSSKLKLELARVLLEEGYIKSYEVKDLKPGSEFKTLRIVLKYDREGFSAFRRLDRMSRPGKRRYSKTLNIPRRLNGAGISILSTNKGLMTDRAARRENVGGEILCVVE